MKALLMFRLKRVTAAAVMFAMFLPLIPFNAVQAKTVSTLFGFKLNNGVEASYAGDQQVGPGEFENGNLANGNSGVYAEGMCVPFAVQLSNTDATNWVTQFTLTFDYDGGGVIGYSGLEMIAGSGVVNATDLSEIDFTGSDLTALTSVATVDGAVASVTVTGPFGPNDDVTPLAAGDDAGHYVLSMTVPANDEVYVPFCARLSDQAGAFSNGSDLQIRLGNGEAISINPSNLLELPEMTVIKTVTDDVAPASDFTMQILDTVNGNAVVAEFPGSSAGTTVQLQPGTYSVVEVPDAAYTTTYTGSCQSVAMDLADVAQVFTCEVTNTLIPEVIEPSTITVRKVIVNDNGGTEDVTDFVFTVNGTTIAEGVTTEFVPGSYTVAEAWAESHEGAILTNWYDVTFSGDCDANGVITLGEEQDAVCTITNNDRAATLTVTKLINGGPVTQSSDFTIRVTGTDVSDAEFPGSATGTTVTLDAGAFSVSEVAVEDYIPLMTAGCSGNLAPGAVASCTITNNYFPTSGTVNVTKTVVGGTAIASDFQYVVTQGGVAGAATAFSNTGATAIELGAGMSFSIDEVAPVGYAVSYNGTCSGVIVGGASVDCEVINTVIPPAMLTVITEVTNDNAGTATVSDVTVRVTDVDGEYVGAGVANPGTERELAPGAFTVLADALAGYDAPVYTGDCTGTIEPGDDLTCTIQLNDTAPVIVPIEDPVMPVLHCVDPSATPGMLTAFFGYDNQNDTQVSIAIGSPDNYFTGGGDIAVDRGQPSAFDPGVHEDVFTVDFADTIPLTWTLESTSTMSVTADANTTRCTPPAPATLTVIKLVVNNNTGIRSAGEFTMVVTGTNVSQPSFPGSELGTVVTLDAGAYSVNEAETFGYTQTFSPGCSGTLLPGDSAVCTITNDDPSASVGGGFFFPQAPVTPPGVVLGDTDEVDETPAEEVGEEADPVVEEVIEVVTPPTPIVLGDADEQLPRTGVPAAGLLLLPSFLLFFVRRRDE